MVGSAKAAKKRKSYRVSMKEAENSSQERADKSISPKVLQKIGKSKAKKTAIEAKATAKLSPSYSKMVVEAIAALKETAGSRRRAISKFIQDEHELPDDFNEILHKELVSLTEKGKIVQVSGSFMLPAKNSEDEKSKKAATKTLIKKKFALKEKKVKNIMAAAHSVDKERSSRRRSKSADTEVNSSNLAAFAGRLVKCSTRAASARKFPRLAAMGEEKHANKKCGRK